ncbi:MAG TPA: diguanylate cyclase [Cyanobacteria bacterium UBA11162]|nr:diguanylate cyclase [Cyanobacteria bacterium UBA11162]
MKFSDVRKIVTATGGVFLFAFLFIKAQAIDLNQHNRYITDLRQINERDTRMNQEILQISSGILNDYDPIVNELDALQDLQTRLKNTPNFIEGQERLELSKILQEHIQILQQKEQLIEDFKSKNSTLKKSLLYLPIAVSNLSVKTTTRLGGYEVVIDLNNLLKNVLLYSASDSEELNRQLQSQINNISQKQKQIYQDPDLDIAIAHAEIILQNKPQVDALVNQIVALPSSQTSEKLAQTYNQHYQDAQRTANFYRLWLYLYSLISLTSLVVYIILKLRKSATLIRQAEEQYRSIVDNSVEGIFRTTPSGRYLSANTTLANIYGYASPEELCASITNIDRQVYVQPNRHAELIDLLEKQDSVSGFESQVYRKDGNIIWIVEKAKAVRDRHGDLIYYEGTVEDITVRRAWQEALFFEQEQSERLLLNILPEPIAERLKQSNSTIADSFAEVTVLFADIVGFTELASCFSPTQVVELLNQIFSAFDELSERYGLEKIKTIGDAYMVVGGLPTPRTNHTEAIAQMALDMQEVINKFNSHNNQTLSIRIGINSGPVVAGVIGIKKFSYDLWGDTVNTASRMESQGVPDRIQVTENTYKQLKHKFKFEERGVIQIKGKGEMTTYFLTGKIEGEL